MPRLFIAIHFSRDVVDWLREIQNALRLELTSQAIRWVKPENIHLTIKFLGETAEERIPRVIEQMEKAANQIDSIKAELGGLGVFPNPSRPRVIWTGISQSANLEKLQEGVERGVNSLGFGEEPRGFSPHLTLARIREEISNTDLAKIRILAEKGQPLQTLSTCPEAICLFKSQLKPGGPDYTIIHRSEFK